MFSTKSLSSRILSVLLTLAMLFSMAPAAFASGSADVTYYVASSDAQGNDNSGSGTEDAPYMTLQKALSTAESANADSVQIILLSDINMTLPLDFSNYALTDVSISGQSQYGIYYTETTAIGSESGFLKVNSNTSVAFTGITLSGSTGAYNGRVLYIANGGRVTLEDANVVDGRVYNVSNNEGGAGAFVANGGTLICGAGAMFSGNSTDAGGGAIFVADGGVCEISDGASISGNTAKYGGGVYVDMNGSFAMSGSASISGNTATDNGGGMFVRESANAAVSGAVTVSGNTAAGGDNNVALATDATLDISGTTVNADIGISAEGECAYRLVSLPDSYSILPTASGDEAGWSDDCGAWDIRHMTYNGVEGLYLYYKTFDMTFSDVTTLAAVEGADISGDDVDFLNDGLSNVTQSGGTLTVEDAVAVGAGKNLVITITVDKDGYRIPTEDIISVTSGGEAVDFSYDPDFENGTATITIAADTVDALTGGLDFTVTADKYYTLTVQMNGPLFAMSTDITGLSEGVFTVSTEVNGSTEKQFKITRGGEPVEGVAVELTDESGSIAARVTTGADGIAAFTGLDANKSYYPILYYSEEYRVIERDTTSFKLSTLSGQTLGTASATDGSLDYDASTGKATLTDVDANTTVTFSVTSAADVLRFEGNEGDATTAPAELSYSSKELPASGTSYGTLPTATLTGYTFLGWYDAAEDGNLITSDTVYTTGSSPKTLYAHWEPNTDTVYKIQHWIEYKADGANEGYVEGTTEKSTKNGVTYYLYTTVAYNDGVSDAIKDITGLDLKTMTNNDYTWWSRDSLVATFEQNCKVLANGSSVFKIWYDRAEYNISFDPSGEGTVTSTSDIDDMTVDYGDAIGTMPEPSLPGYSFGGWYDGETLVTPTTIYQWGKDIELTAHWNARKDVQWAIKVATQDIARDDDGVYYAADTYTEYKTVYLDNSGNLLTGTADTTVTFSIADFKSLDIEGFNYIGYLNKYDQNANGITKNTTTADVYVIPTDASTQAGNAYNKSFDGGIVWLYFARNTADVKGPDGNKTGEVVYGGDFTGQLPDDPAKDGYDFDNWVDENGKTVDETTPADAYTGEDGAIIDLTPTWTAREYYLTYVPGSNASFTASDGSAGTKSATVSGGYTDSHPVTYDQKMGTMPSASKKGYTFDGWKTEGGLNVTSDTDVNINTVVIHNDNYSYENTRVLYAQYTPHTYTLVLNAGQSSVTGDKGTVSPSTVTVTYDAEVSGLPVPTLTGYKFVGWYLDINGPTGLIQNGDIWTYARENGAEIQLYAKYTPEQYRYTFDMNDTTGSTRGSFVDTTIEYVDETFDSVYDGVFEVEAVRSGYQFDGWSLTKNGDVLTAEDIVKIAEDTTLYAHWTPLKYTVTFVMKGAEMDLSGNSTAKYSEADDAWTIQVDFDSTYGTLPVPSKDDCVYNGWLAGAPNWSDIDDEVIKTLPQYVDYLDENGITLTAVMEPIISFDPNGEKFDDGTSDVKKILQSDLDEIPEIEKDGYEFVGWTDGEDILDLDDILELEEPVTLTPVLSAIITFDANGGKVKGESSVKIALCDMTALPTASRSGYSFNGWYTEKEDGEKVTLDELAEANVPVTVYAQYSAVSSGGGAVVSTHTVSFDAGEGTPVPDQEVASGGYATEPVSLLRGYEVEGWYTEDGKKFDFAKDKVTSDMTLTAKWVYVGVSAYLTTDHIAYVYGYTDGSVKPMNNITRAEVAAIFYRLLKDDVREMYNTTEHSFNDIPEGAWYETEVATLANMGILLGYQDGSFGGDQPITRAEFAVICSRFDADTSEQGGSFSDISGHWAERLILRAAALGWVHGYTDGTFRPDNNITRAEAMQLLNNVLNRSSLTLESIEGFEGMKTFTDNLDTGKWYYLTVQEATNTHDHEFDENGTEIWVND